MDNIVDGDPENIGALLHALADFGEGHARELAVSDFTDEEGAIRVIEEFPLVIFVRLRGHSYADLKAHTAWHHTEGITIPYLDAQGLVLLKAESSREKDQIDIQALRKLIDE